MKYLQEIVQLSASLRKEKVDFFSWNKRNKPKTKFEILYSGLLDGTIFDDKSACSKLYNNSKAFKSSTYNSLKTRLFWRLTNSLFFVDQDRIFINRYNKVIYLHRKNATLVRILEYRGAIAAAAYIAKKNLPQAIEYHLADEVCIYSMVLSQLASLSGKTNEFEKYVQIVKQWQDKKIAITQAEVLFNRVTSWYAAQWDLQQEKLIEISNYYNIVNSLRKEYDCYKIHETYFLLKRIHAEVEQDYNVIISICNEALNYYKTNDKFSSNQSKAIFIIPIFSAYIWIGDYKSAFIYANECSKLLRPGSQNWFAFQEPHFILALRSKNYQLAKQIFIEVTTHPNFNFKNEVMIEKWRLHEFYARFISQEDFKQTLLPKGIRGKHKHFRAFASTLPTLSKDLTGHNVVAVFAHILYLIRIGDFDTLIQRDESLQVLRRKRLTKLNYRLGIFARMIHIMVEHNFNPVPTQKFAKKWQNKLKHMPEKFKGGTAETLEIIPFEDLWEMMMNELKAVKHNSK